MFVSFINLLIIASLVFLGVALVYEASQFVPEAPIPHVTPALSPAPEMPLEMPVFIAPDTLDAELLETRPIPVLTSSTPVQTCPETEAVEDSPEDIPDTIALPDFHSMSVRALRKYCQSESITGYSKYAKCGKQVLADWLEVRALGQIGRANTENLRDRYPEGSEVWNALNDIAQTL